jgi:hypothetical protein
MATNILRLAAGGEIEFLSAETVVKFIIKSSCLLLLLISVLSAKTTDEIYSAAHVSYACKNALVVGILSAAKS